MLVSRILQRINELLDGETLSYYELRPHIDSAIDDINQELNTIFPTFSDLPQGATEYNHIPDRYIRSVVCYGAAVHFYMMDEEGGNPPMGYTDKYRQNMFLMLRDYIHQIPEEYQAPSTQGTVAFSLNGSDRIGYGVQQGDFVP